MNPGAWEKHFLGGLGSAIGNRRPVKGNDMSQVIIGKPTIFPGGNALTVARRERKILATYVVHPSDGAGLAHTHSGNSLRDVQRFGAIGGYQEVGLAACFIDY